MIIPNRLLNNGQAVTRQGITQEAEGAGEGTRSALNVGGDRV